MKNVSLTIGQDFVKLIAEIDEFKGRWEALKTLSPDRLNALRRVATVESAGSSTRLEGAKLTDIKVETLLSNVRRNAFRKLACANKTQAAVQALRLGLIDI